MIIIAILLLLLLGITLINIINNEKESDKGE